VNPSPDVTWVQPAPAELLSEKPWDGFLEEIAIELDSEELEEDS
jgi:hypothetical protein